jgi:hypothetical protein
MRLRGSHYIALASALTLGACAGVPVHESLPVAAQDKISSTDVVLPIRQSEIYVFVPSSQIAAAGGGGLLLALVDAGVDSVRTSKAEAAVKPLRDAMVDYSFDEVLTGDVKASLSSIAWMHVGNVRVLKEVTNDTLDGALAASKADAVLFTTADYQLSNDGNVLTVTVVASLFPNSAALRELKKQTSTKPVTVMANSLYHNTLTFVTKLPNSNGSERDANIARWDAEKRRNAARRSEVGCGDHLADARR